MSTAQNLLAEIEAFLIKHDMPPTVFGRQSCSDPHVVSWLRRGGGVTSGRIDKIVKFMRDYRPSQKNGHDANAAA